MFVKQDFRGSGLGSQILKSIEDWAKELGFKYTLLETGKRQTEAVNLYKRTYETIPNYGQYEEIEDSICFKKSL